MKRENGRKHDRTVNKEKREYKTGYINLRVREKMNASGFKKLN